MHGTAMNMAKKQHKVAEGKFTSELTRQLQLEVLNMQQRRAIGMRMRRLAQKIARTKARKKKRMKTNDQLKTKAMKQARAILFKKMSGGKAASELAMGARIAIGKKLDKKKGVIQKLSKKKRNNKARKPSGFVKPTLISNELAAFLGKDKGSEMARTEVTREINAYIRKQSLQDKTNGRKIIPEAQLAKLL